MESVGGKLSEIVNCEGFEESLFLNWRSRLFLFRADWEVLEEALRDSFISRRLSSFRKVLLSGEEALKICE